MELGRSTSHGDSLPNPIPGQQEGQTTRNRLWRSGAFSQINPADVGRLRGRGSAVALAAILTFGSGCAGSKLWKDDSDSKTPSGVPSSSLSSLAKSDPNQVMLTSGTSGGASLGSFNWMTGKYDKGSKQPATEIAIGWRHWIDYLPDPTRDGKMGPGLAGQMFLFSHGLQTVDAEGTLTVDLYDETPYPPGQTGGNIPERWVFTKDALKKLHSVDERFGKCYVLFLPWVSYRPEVTKVRISVRYEADGKVIIPEESRFTISPSPTSMNTTLPNDSAFGLQQLGPISLLGGVSQAGFGTGLSSSNGFAPNGLSGDSMPLGVIGSLPNGASMSNRPMSILPPTSSAMPISGAAMTNMPLSNMPGSAAMPMTPGAFQAPPPGMMSPPSAGNGGLMPVGGGPQGLPPLAYSVNPNGH